MPEYIEREAVIERLTNLMQLQAPTARAIIEAIPAADVRPVEHGVWIKIKYRSICRDCSFRGFASWKYCPNCGLRMTTEGDNGS